MASKIRGDCCVLSISHKVLIQRDSSFITSVTHVNSLAGNTNMLKLKTDQLTSE